MTQRIFDMDNPWDVHDLFELLPSRIQKGRRMADNSVVFLDKDGAIINSNSLFCIDWQDKTEITRPVDETQFIGKLCWFQEEKHTMPFIGILESITGKLYKCEAHLTPCIVCRPVRRDEVQFADDAESKE